MRTPIIICLLISCMHAGYAQPGKKQVVAELQKLAGVYKNASRLSFDVSYRYAAEDKPDAWLDSLSGHCKLSGARYWYDINNMESVRTDNYVILLFKEDQVMYLAKPNGASAVDAGAAMASPAGQLETLLKNDTAIVCNVNNEKSHKKITIDFTRPGVYKRIEYYTSKITGYLEKIVSWVKSDQLYDASVRNLVDANGSYAIVEIVYTNYKQGSFEDAMFNNEQYFKKEGDQFVTVAPYQTYKIFKGTPNL